MKFFVASLFCLLANISSIAYAQSTTENFINSSQSIIKATLGNYKKDIQYPLAARMFDIGDPMYYNFLSGGTGQKNYQKDHVAVVYFDNAHNQFKIDNQPTSFCFILYNSKDKNFLDNYMKAGYFSWDNLVYYLNYHELGHCISAFEGEHVPDQKITSPQLEETLADSFAIAMFLNHDNDKEALGILELNKNLKKEDVHYNPQVLQNFYNNYKNANFHSTHVKEIFQKTYQTLSNITNLN
jgi:hypothetical protein